MLTRFRVHAPRIAAMLLLSLGAMGASLVTGHAYGDHDEDGAIVLVAHDASAHRVGAGGPAFDGPPLHCLVCHWARSFRPQTETAFLPAPADQAGARTYIVAFTVAPAAQVAQPPLRSPPSVPALS
jgi:hypothetical protein